VSQGFRVFDWSKCALEVEELQSCLEDLGILVRGFEGFSESRVLVGSNVAGGRVGRLQSV
jgi:hypothetical protein